MGGHTAESTEPVATVLAIRMISVLIVRDKLHVSVHMGRLHAAARVEKARG